MEDNNDGRLTSDSDLFLLAAHVFVDNRDFILPLSSDADVVRFGQARYDGLSQSIVSVDDHETRIASDWISSK